MKVSINHISIVEKGNNGPWGYALVNAPDAPKGDTVELRGLGLDTFQRIAAALPGIKAAGQMLSLDAEVRVEELVQNFTTKAGEPATKNVVRLYLESTPQWARVVRPVIDEGNLSDVLGPIAADDEF
jgi:hypothetical protein